MASQGDKLLPSQTIHALDPLAKDRVDVALEVVTLLKDKFDSVDGGQPTTIKEESDAYTAALKTLEFYCSPVVTFSNPNAACMCEDEQTIRDGDRSVTTRTRRPCKE